MRPHLSSYVQLLQLLLIEVFHLGTQLITQESHSLEEHTR